MMRSARPKTKVIVRNLPYNLTEQDFKGLIQEHMNGVDYFYYFPGKKGSALSVPSRAYMHFSDAEKMYVFSEKLDGHKFVDGKGLSISCSVELSLSQRWTDASNRRDKSDKTTNTIEQDEHYTKFLEVLSAPPVAPKEEPAPANPNPNDLSKPMSTPILDDLRRKAALKQQQMQEKQAKQKEKRDRQKQKKDRTGAAPAATAGGKKGSGAQQVSNANPSKAPASAAVSSGPIRIAQKPAGSSGGMISADAPVFLPPLESPSLTAALHMEAAAAAAASESPATAQPNGSQKQQGRQKQNQNKGKKNSGRGGKANRGGGGGGGGGAAASATPPAPNAAAQKKAYSAKPHGNQGSTE